MSRVCRRARRPSSRPYHGGRWQIHVSGNADFLFRVDAPRPHGRPERLGLSELAVAVKMPKSTVHRLDRLLFAADYPFEEFEDGARWLEHVPISEHHRRKLASENARTLLRF
jgi:hypothetical protein